MAGVAAGIVLAVRPGFKKAGPPDRYVPRAKGTLTFHKDIAPLIFEHCDTIAYNQRVLQENPNDAFAHAKIGQALLPLGRYAEAFEHLRAAIRLNPNDDKPHYDLGSLYLLHNQLADAKTEFETVLRLNPDDYQAHGSLGAVYLQLRNFEQAEAHFTSALRLNPEDTVARRNLDLVLAAKRSQHGIK